MIADHAPASQTAFVVFNSRMTRRLTVIKIVNEARISYDSTFSIMIDELEFRKVRGRGTMLFPAN